MKRMVCALAVALAGSAIAQNTLEARVKPATAAHEEATALDPDVKATVDALVIKLGDDDRKVRRQAKDDLLKLGKTGGPYLVPYLKTDDVEVRESVKKILATLDPNAGLDPNSDEPAFFRKRALMKGEQPKTVGEKLWLDEYRKRREGAANALQEGADAIRPQEDAEMREIIQAREKAAAEAAAKAAIQKLIAEKDAALAKAKAEAEKKASEEKAKAEAEKKQSN